MIEIPATQFENFSATTKKDLLVSKEMLEHTVPALEKRKSPWLKLARFGDERTDKGSLRHDQNVTALTGAECDYDDEMYTMEFAVARLQEVGIRSLLYTSASNSQETPRWRVLLPFAREMVGTEDQMRAYRKAAVRIAEAALGLAFSRESYKLSQSYYYGPIADKKDAFAVVEVDGDYIDVLYDLTQAVVADEVASETGTTLQRSEFDLRAVVNEVMTSANYHEATNSLFGHLAYHDVPENSALTVVQEVMKASAGSDMERYQARFDDLERCCADIYKAEASKRAKAAGDVWSGSNIGYEETFVSEPKTIDFIIDGILPATSFGIAGAGGTMKSTTVLRIMIHVILGKAIFDHEVSKPGQCIFVTSEDDVDMIRYRVRQMCEAMKLTESECRGVGHGLIVEDVNGKIARLVEQDSNGNLAFAPSVDAFVTRYQYRNLSIVAFDPLIYFSPGEQYVNDGPGQLMNVGRHLSKALGCATGFIHHTGQEAARSGIVDQYAGRGGSAFADNARMVGIMAPPAKGKDKPQPPPEVSHQLELFPDTHVALLWVPKVSYAKAPTHPVWILRNPDNPWQFNDYMGGGVDEQAEVERVRNDAAKAQYQVIRKIWLHICSEVEEGRYPTKTTLKGDRLKMGLKLGVNALTDHVNVGISHGFIVPTPVPPEVQTRHLKEYLAAGAEPNESSLRGKAVTHGSRWLSCEPSHEKNNAAVGSDALTP